VSAKATVLIVDDEKHAREGLARALAGEYAVATAENGARAMAWLREHAADVVLTDLRMPEMGGMDLLGRLLALPDKPAVVMLTAYGNVGTAVEAMKKGAFDFIEKPVDLDKLDVLVARAVGARGQKSKVEGRRSKADGGGEGEIVGESAAMKALMETVRRVAPSRATVLLQGESGTGKELVARALHAMGDRAKKPFVAVHCAALSPTLLESELFGHEKGAFTGAVERRKGRFELADGGTLFLDEIGEISQETQVKILRVLEERAFERVGGTETIKVDVRVVAATNRDLRAEVAAGRFREDLFYRLYVVNLTMPPLREREGDVALLARFYLKRFAEEYGREARKIDPAAMAALAAYRWPGNVRELRNAMERMVVLCVGDTLRLEDVPEGIRGGAGAEKTTTPQAGGGERTQQVASLPEGPVAMESGVAATERRLVREALERAGGNREAAARALGISVRTLYRKMKELRVSKE
jgi:DNA-binding NtrC family response regulator